MDYSEEEKQPRSPAWQLLNLAWNKPGHQMGRSHDRDYHAMQAALRMAIKYGFEFHPDDFSMFCKDFSYGWRGPCWLPSDVEWFYTLAAYGNDVYGNRGYGVNRSACIAFEKWKDRPPFMYRKPGKKTPRRLAVNSRIMIERQSWWVTSFVRDVVEGGDGEWAMILCSYKDGGLPEGKPLKRRKMTREDLKYLNAGNLPAVLT